MFMLQFAPHNYQGTIKQKKLQAFSAATELGKIVIGGGFGPFLQPVRVASYTYWPKNDRGGHRWVGEQGVM